MKSTSIKAYHEAVEEGTITKREREVLAYLANKEATGRQIDKVVPDGHKRLKSLEDKGMICRVGTTKDQNTGKIVYKWATTYNKQPMLIPVAKKPSRGQLEAMIDGMKKIIDNYQVLMETAYNNGFIMGAASVGNVVQRVLEERK